MLIFFFPHNYKLLTSFFTNDLNVGYQNYATTAVYNVVLALFARLFSVRFKDILSLPLLLDGEDFFYLNVFFFFRSICTFICVTQTPTSLAEIENKIRYERPKNLLPRVQDNNSDYNINNVTADDNIFGLA